MENENDKPKLPVIVISSIESESKDVSIKSLAYSGEIEEQQEDGLVQELLNHLDLAGCVDDNVDPLIHYPNLPAEECPHCKIMKKVIGLQAEITKMNSEISCTHEVLSLKKQQNAELKSTIKRLENSLGKSEGIAIEQKETTCSCGTKCLLL
jgi:glutaredoxin